MELGEHGGGERGGYGKEAGAVRRREREGPKAVEGRTLGGSWKKAGWKPRRKEGKAEEKNGEGRLAWPEITKGMQECLQDKKTTGRLRKTARWK